MSAADRGAWRLVAARDFWVRLRERSFLISTILNIARDLRAGARARGTWCERDPIL